MTTATTPIEVEDFAVADLLFDSRNPRLRGEAELELDQQEIFELLWRDFSVDELAGSIAANGYFAYEPMFVAEEPEGLVVVEGNRRLAAVKALLGQMKLPSGGGALPKVTRSAKAELEEVPCLLTERANVWQYVGFKHVNGPQQWQSASKAEYIAWVHNDLDVPLSEIARRIGDRHATVQRLYRALMVIEQAEAADVFQRADRYRTHFSFSHLYTGLDYGGISKFVKVAPTGEEKKRPIPKARIKELGELCQWLYGSKTREKVPLVKSQNPDLRVLDEVIQSTDGVSALRRGLPLRVSLDISKGDSQLLREALVAAKEYLQTARGRVLTGFGEGQSDLIGLAEDCSTLADAVYAEFLDLERRRRGSRTRRSSSSASKG